MTGQQPVAVPGFELAVLASRGCEDKARGVAARCQAAYAFLAGIFDTAPVVGLLVLSEADWGALAGTEPYGMPFFGHGLLHVAGGRAAFWTGLAAAVSATPGSADQVHVTYGTGDGVDLTPFFDLLVVHELTHAFAAHLPYGFGRRWLEELFCNLALHAYVATSEPAELDHLCVFPQAFVALDASSFQRDLAYFEAVYSGMAPDNYAWYQCRLHVAAAEIFAGRGVDALHGLWDLGRRSDDLLGHALAEYIGPTAGDLLGSWPA